MPQVIIPFSLYGGAVSGRFVENKETGYHAYFVTDEERGLKNIRPAGVTTILGIKDKSRALLPWATGLARDYLESILLDGKVITTADIYEACRQYEVRKEEAANIGDLIHNWIEQYIKWRIGLEGFGEPMIPQDKAIQLGVIAFLDWEADHKVKFISSERIIYSRQHCFIGKMDIEALVDGKLALGDIKTGNGLYNSVRAQTAAYLQGDEEERNHNSAEFNQYDTRWAIRLSKETKEDYDKRMAKKGLKDWPDYQVFEAMEFADEVAEDFKWFLDHKGVYDRDKKTDFYLNRNKK